MQCNGQGSCRQSGLSSPTLAQFIEAIQPVYHTAWIGRASADYIPNAGAPVTEPVDGWTAHQTAPIPVVLPAVPFASDIDFGPIWMRFRYWIASAMLAICLIPINVDGDSGSCVMIGRLAVFIVIIAALFRQKEA